MMAIEKDIEIIPFNKTVKNGYLGETYIKNISVRHKYYANKGDKFYCSNGHHISTVTNDAKIGEGIYWTGNAWLRPLCGICGSPWPVGGWILFEDGLRVTPDFDINSLEVVE